MYGCRTNAAFEQQHETMKHCDEALAVKLAECIGGKSGYELFLASTKSSLIFAYGSGALYYAPFCTLLLLRLFSSGQFYLCIKFSLFSTQSPHSSFNFAVDTKEETDPMDILK